MMVGGSRPGSVSFGRAMAAAMTVTAAAAAALGASGGFTVRLAAQAVPPSASPSAPTTSAMRVVPNGDARFVPADPARPDGAQIAILRGDPDTGPSDILIKMKKTDGRLHVHSSDYRLIVLSGRMKHWTPAEDPAESRVLEAGSYWFQPGNDPHGDACLTDECLMFITWSGKRDGRLVDAAPAAPRR